MNCFIASDSSLAAISPASSSLPSLRPAPCAFDRPWRNDVLKKSQTAIREDPRPASPALSRSHSIETPELLIMKVALAARVALLAAAIYAVAAQPQCPAPVGLAPLTPAVRRPNRVEHFFCSFLSKFFRR